MNVFPDFSAVAGSATLPQVVGALLTYVLIASVLMLILSGVAWAIATSTGNAHSASRARLGVVVAVAASALAGAGVAWANFLMHIGSAI